MAGRLFEVFKNARWSSVLETCPEELEGTSIKVKPADDEALELVGEAACLSGFIKKSISLTGPDVEVDTKLKKSTLAKVVEYLRYHKDTAPGEIAVPLTSDNLAECGVSKWDASFINVDRELLFELFMAASCLDIPSLAILAAAKASLLYKGKTPEKLRKDAGMKNDLPEDEEEGLTQDHMATLPEGTNMEEAHLAGLAMIMQGMVKAAESSGIFCDSIDALEPCAPTGDLSSFRVWSWHAAVTSDWKLIEKAPEQVRGDRDLMFDTLRQSRGAALAHATEKLKADPDIVLAAVKYGGDLSEASFSLRSDREFVMKAIMANGSALEGASDSIRGNKELILEAAMKGQGSALKGASGHLSSDRSFALSCIALDPEAYRFVEPRLQESLDFAMDAVRRNGMALQYVPASFKADRSLVTAAIRNAPLASVFAHTAARADLGAAAPWDPPVTENPPGGSAGEVYTGSRQVGLSRSQQAKDQGMDYYHVKVQKSVQFSALSSMFANMGQGNYIAANMMLDKFPFVQRPAIDAVTVMWGAVGAIGMRWKAFASQDFLNATPDILMGVEDCCKILHLLTCRMDTPEWTSASLNVTPEMLAPTAGVIGGQAGGGFRPGENAGATVESALERHHQSTGSKGLQQAEDKGEAAPIEAGPLGGWPRLSHQVQQTVVEETLYTLPDLQLVEGAHVRLTGLQAKNGMAGVVQQHFPDKNGGKWKVELDFGGGSAQLKECYLEVIAPPDPHWREKAVAAAAELKAARVARKAGTSRPSVKTKA